MVLQSSDKSCNVFQSPRLFVRSLILNSDYVCTILSAWYFYKELSYALKTSRCPVGLKDGSVLNNPGKWSLGLHVAGEQYVFSHGNLVKFVIHIILLNNNTWIIILLTIYDNYTNVPTFLRKIVFKKFHSSLFKTIFEKKNVNERLNVLNSLQIFCNLKLMGRELHRSRLFRSN